MIALAVGAALLLAFANGANDNFKGVATLYGSKTTAWFITAPVAGCLGFIVGCLVSN